MWFVRNWIYIVIVFRQTLYNVQFSRICANTVEVASWGLWCRFSMFIVHICVFAARCYACAALAVTVCLSVGVSRLYILSKRINVSSIFFSPSGSHTIVIISYQTAWQSSDGNFPNGGVKCRWSRQKARFWASGFIECYQRCNRPGTTGPRSRKLWHLSLVVSDGVCW